MSQAAVRALQAGTLPKGDALAVARTAGILAAKRTPELIPLCHPIPLSHIAVDFTVDVAEGVVEIEARARANAPTGVEMEAFTAAAIAAVTIYDMCKSLDPGAEIVSIALVRKSGGESGTWRREQS
jgi:cyclic pyranopterin phosphate synthase